MGRNTGRTPARGTNGLRTPVRGVPLDPNGVPLKVSDGKSAATRRMSADQSVVFQIASRDESDPMLVTIKRNKQLERDLEAASRLVQDITEMHSATYQQMVSAELASSNLANQYRMLKEDKDAAIRQLTEVAQSYRHQNDDLTEELAQLLTYSPDQIPWIFRRFPWLEHLWAKRAVSAFVVASVVVLGLFAGYKVALAAAIGIAIGMPLQRYLSFHSLPNRQ